MILYRYRDRVVVPKEFKTLSIFSFLAKHFNKRVNTALYKWHHLYTLLIALGVETRRCMLERGQFTIFIFEAENVGERMCRLVFQVSPSSNMSPWGSLRVTFGAVPYNVR